MFKDEDEFQAFFIRNFGNIYLGDWIYAKITKIAGEFIQPEIDLLDITPIAPRQELNAFEFKVLNSKIFGNNYSHIYAGIGQALSYFKYGVDQSYLIIGISDNIETKQGNTLLKMISEAGKAISDLRIDRFQIKVYREFQNEIRDYPALAPTGKFVRSELPREFLEYDELARDNLCALNFPKQKGNNYFKKHNLNQYT